MTTSSSRYIARLKTRVFLVTLMMAGLTISPPKTLGQLPDALSDQTQVSLLTLLPGEPIYAAFAHSAVRFLDEQTGADIVFNYGTFDPTAPYFVGRFAYGEMDYYLSVYSMRVFMNGAVLENRSVIEQTLQMTPDHVAELYARLKTQAQPENRVYRYDFIAENCSTILLDLFRETEGAALQFDSSGATPVTYRQLLQPYLDQRPFWDLGIDLVLGARIDGSVPYFDRDFLPLELMRIVDGATVEHISVTDSNSTREVLPYASVTDTLFWVGPGFSENGAFPWLAWLAWISVIGLIAWSHFGRVRKEKITFRADRWFFGVLGFLGFFLTFMWFGTTHYVTDYNFNIVWALPTHLLVAIAWKKVKPTTLRLYFISNVFLLGILVAAQIVVPQHLHPVYFALVAVIAWRSWEIARNESN